ncbi:MAG: TolC family protein [Acidobacteriia bacterium]|nr:TolC family protein [Terriglobia bacterium]
MSPKRQHWLLAALTLGLLLVSQTLGAQEAKPSKPPILQYGNTRWFPTVWAPYGTPYVPASNMSNSERLHSLLQDGKLYLTVSDAIALGLENNLDIAVSRYNIGYAQTDILRAQGGGAARGFAGSFSSAALFAGAIGGGVTSGGGGGTSRAGGTSGGASASQFGGGTFDPSVFFSMGWDRNTSPLGTTVVTGVPFVTSQGTSYTMGYTQAFQTGTSFQVFTGGSRGTTTSLTPVFNPQVNTFLGTGFTQPLLNGFGRRANSIQIRIAQDEMKSGYSLFRQQVITTVAQILNNYWDYLTFRENVRVAEQALAYAQKLLSDNKRQVEIGTLAPIEVVRAESEVAGRQQDLIVAQTNLQQQAEIIKTALSKQVGPELAGAQIVAQDNLPEPQSDDVPSLDEALKLAFANRPEIEQSDLKLRDQDYTIAARRNSLLPSLNIFASYIAVGLAGNQLICPAGSSSFGGQCIVQGDGFVPTLGTSAGGVSQALSQTWKGQYPDYSFGLTLSIPIRNRSAQADAARALLERRQLETQLQQFKNNIAQQVRSAEIGVIQAKAQVEAARKAVVLYQQSLDAEQKKFQLGESTVFLVIQAQRDLATAEGNEVKARSTYAKSVTQFQQQTATILQKYNVELSDAISGHVERSPNIPGAPSTPPPSTPPGS